MKSMTIMAMTFMSVAAVPMAKEAHLENLVSTLFNGPKASEHNRVRRAEDELDMCSYRMQNITRLADVAGAVFVSIFWVLYWKFFNWFFQLIFLKISNLKKNWVGFNIFIQMSVDDSPLYRKSRNHISFVDLEQPGIYRHIEFKPTSNSFYYHLTLHWKIDSQNDKFSW